MNRLVLIAALAWATTTLPAAVQAGYIYQYQFGSSGSGNGQLNFPYGVALDSSGNAFVADFNNNRIEQFNSSTGAYIATIGSSGSGNGQLSYPTGVAVDGSGNVFVSDNGNSRIEEFNSAGRLRHRIRFLRLRQRAVK